MSNSTDSDFAERVCTSETKESLQGQVPESWLCIACGVNTAPGLFNRAEMEKAFAARAEDEGVEQHINDCSEVYTVRDAIWKKAGMEPWGGCLCIGCLEKRLGRKLKPKDFRRDDALNHPALPGTPRLIKRRGRPHGPWGRLR